MKKILLLVISLLLLSACQRKNPILIAELVHVVDNLEYADSAEHFCRGIRLAYRIVNQSEETYYLPIHNIMGHKDSTLIFSLSNKEKVSPDYYFADLHISAENKLVHPHDTCYIAAWINSIFTEKEPKYLTAPTRDILNILNTTFNLDSADLYEGCPEVPTILFNNDVNDIIISYDVMNFLRAKRPS